ncbi:MAG TPA: tetratricopeptide repeat protein [Kiritimatiellia bacterium]|nr:tetratricopeptide repeat protein [Kiritimatiellia bacterium]HRZ12776.1 tetratricopeptide repeat protein [Kiritimatiellia bacterium]HSA18272.1 tetratricopeptide repeat protein [Kiritimatiellia bacterium]
MHGSIRLVVGRAVISVLTLLALPSPAEEDPNSPFLQDLTEAYVTLGRANRAREEESWEQALSLYEDAHAQYRRLHNLYPDRQPDIVQYRLADCANQIEALRRRLGPNKRTGPRPASEAAPSRDPASADFADENRSLRERLAAAETNAARTAAMSGQDIARLTAELQAAEAQRVADRASLEAEKKQLEEARGEIARLKQDLDGAARNLKKIETERDSLRAARETLEETAKSLARELETARARLEAEQAAAAPLVEARQAEQEQRKLLEQAEAQLAEARQATEALRASLDQSETQRAQLTERAAERQEEAKKDRQARKEQAAELEAVRSQLAEEQAASASLRERIEAAEARIQELQNSASSPAAGISPSPPDRAAEKIRRAMELERTGKLEAALTIYRSSPGRPDMVKGAGRCLLKLNRAGEAVDVLTAEAGPAQDAESRLLLGIGLCTLRRYAEAAATLEAALPSDPQNPALHNALGVARIGQGKLAEARQELEQAVALNPDLGDAHLNLALVLAADPSGDRAQVRDHYKRALELGVAPEPHLEKTLGKP